MEVSPKEYWHLMPFPLKVTPTGLPPQDQILKGFIHSFCSYFVFGSEFNCFAKLAKA